MTSSGKASHVGADFGEEDLDRGLAQARNLLESFNRVTKGLKRPAPHFSSLFASQIRIIDQDVTLEFVAGVALAPDFHQLLLDEPSGVPLHAQLSGALKGGDGQKTIETMKQSPRWQSSAACADATAPQSKQFRATYAAAAAYLSGSSRCTGCRCRFTPTRTMSPRVEASAVSPLSIANVSLPRS
jgi:hypothetical protein